MAQAASDMVTLKIPRRLYDRLQRLIAGTGFRSVTEFATYVLRDLASRPASQPRGEKRPAAQGKGAVRRSSRPKSPEKMPDTGSNISDDELKAIVNRLKDLGYL